MSMLPYQFSYLSTAKLGKYNQSKIKVAGENFNPVAKIELPNFLTLHSLELNFLVLTRNMSH